MSVGEEVCKRKHLAIIRENMGKTTDILKRYLFWHVIRRKRIIRQHARVAELCNLLISNKEEIVISSVRNDLPQNIIWQYWAQGFENVPTIVKQCLESVDKWKGDYTVIRLTDNNLSKYIELPDYIVKKKEQGIIPLAQFSDILRVCLLSTYGGVWLDATILLTGTLPQRYGDMDFFVFQRDPEEPNKKYWENVYAYYYGWSKGFRVNMLNSVIFSKKDSAVIKEMAQLLLSYWKNSDKLPDYFFFQILFDVLINCKLKGHNCPIESDCTPHFLQQSINDPKFNLCTKEEILKRTSIHKLTYK